MRHTFALVGCLLALTTGVYAADQFTFPFTVKATTPPPTTTVATGMTCTPAAPPFSNSISIGTLVTSCTVQPANWNGNLKPLSNQSLGVSWTGYNTFALKALVVIGPGSYTETVSATP